MGIRGLTTFAALCNLCEHKVKKFLPNSAQQDKAKLKIVVDGGALIHHLYFAKKIDFISGGQLDQLEHEVTVFFNALLHAGFSPYVIFDGITPDIKVQECVLRQSTSVLNMISHMAQVDVGPHKQILTNPILPVLSQQVMIHVLNQLKVPFSVSDYEADAVAGTHANNNGCAILSKDSDFYVFPVAQGYIGLDSLQVFSDKLTFDFFKTEILCDLLKLKPALLPAFASLCGNDFVSRESLWGFQMSLRNEYPASTLNVPDSKCYDIARVGRFLSNYNTQEEAFEGAANLSNKHFEVARIAREQAELFAKMEEAKRNEKTASEQAKKSEEAKLSEESKSQEDKSNEAVGSVDDAKPSEETKPTDEPKQGTDETKEVTTQKLEEVDALQENIDNLEISAEKDETKEQNERERIFAMDPETRKTNLLSLLLHSAEQYMQQNITVGKDTSLSLHPLLVSRYNNSAAIPLSLLHQYRQYLFNDELMAVLCKLTTWCVNNVENTARPKSAWMVGQPIRRVLYGILCGGGAYAPDAENKDSSNAISITEYVREGDKFVANKVTPSYLLLGKKLPSLPAVMGLPQKPRLNLFLDILSSNTNAIAEFDQKWIFAIAALRALIVNRAEDKDRKIFEWEIMAIILNFVSRPPFAQSINLRQQQSLPRTRDLLHFMAEFRAIIYASILACNCLFNPIPVPSPAVLYDGEIILHYLVKCQNKNLDYRKVMLKKAQDIELFEKIYAAVTEGLDSKIAKKDDVKLTEAEEKKKEILDKFENKKTSAEQKRKESVKQNMFDMLADDETPEKPKSNTKKTPAKKK